MITINISVIQYVLLTFPLHKDIIVIQTVLQRGGYKMNVKWEQRSNGYFAYIRHSWREEGKTKTINKYLGNCMKMATNNLYKFSQEQNLSQSKTDSLVQSLVSEGKKLCIPEIVFPIVNFEEYPEGVLEFLEKAIKENGKLSNDFQENRRKFSALKEALKPVMDIREKALEFPDIDIRNIEPGTTVKKAVLDLRADDLINKVLNLQQQFIDYFSNQ